MTPNKEASNMATTRTLTPQAEQRFCDAVLLWLSALIALVLLPISPETVHNLQTVLIVGGPSAVAFWVLQYAGPGDLTPPSRVRTATYTLLTALLAGAAVMAWVHGVGNATVASGLPFTIGLFATATLLTPVIGLWAVPRPVAVAMGSLAALAAGLLIGERDALSLICQFALAGMAVGAVYASFLARARELAAASPTCETEDSSC